MIFVTGATGNVGSALVRELVQRGRPVRALVRGGHPPPYGAEPVAGDLTRPETFAAQLEGATGLFMLSGYDGEGALLARAREAGVERVALLSNSAAPGGDRDNAVARYHIDSEAAVRASGMAWTLLRPNTFMTNTLEWAEALGAGLPVSAPFADVAVATIDPADIAAVAAEALTTSDLDERALRLSGPEALLPVDRARILGEVRGRDVPFEAQSDEEARAEMLTKMPEPYVDAFFDFFVTGSVDETTVHPTVEQVLGRPPRTFRAWAQAHAERFG